MMYTFTQNHRLRTSSNHCVRSSDGNHTEQFNYLLLISFQLYNFFNDAISHLQSQRAPSKIGSMSDLVGSPNGNGNNIIEALSFTPRPSSRE